MLQLAVPGGEDEVDLAFDGPYLKIVFPAHQREDIFDAWGVPLEFSWDIFLSESEPISVGDPIFNGSHFYEEGLSLHTDLQVVGDSLRIFVLSSFRFHWFVYL